MVETTSMLADLLDSKRFLAGVVIVQAVLMVLLLMFGIYKVETQQLVVTSYDLERKVVFSKRQATDSMLESFHKMILPRITNYTPETIDRNIDAILPHVSPSSFGRIDTGFKAAAEAIKKTKTTQVFFEKETGVRRNGDIMEVISNGLVLRKISATETFKGEVDYIITYNFKNKEIWVEDIRFEEIPENGSSILNNINMAPVQQQKQSME